MNRVSICLAAAGVALAVFPAVAANLKRGAAIAQANCGPCHAVGRSGPSRNAAAPPFRTLSARYPISSLQEALAEGIMVGHEDVGMPEFNFSVEEVDDLVAYIDSLSPRKKKR
ncbi:cytochrome c6 [Alsobacter metallidurans]|uniref:Cytochrome c6 n=1 Tax=Alsobacter metallidurans TaxID=340221 RepID=A0A917I967_9HYPH|nr:cytochrome c [Alsobacter metallidurans]GGH28213.1 cytochrome c6 [Alsobacter metallidurans]